MNSSGRIVLRDRPPILRMNRVQSIGLATSRMNAGFLPEVRTIEHPCGDGRVQIGYCPSRLTPTHRFTRHQQQPDFEARIRYPRRIEFRLAAETAVIRVACGTGASTSTKHQTSS